MLYLADAPTVSSSLTIRDIPDEDIIESLCIDDLDPVERDERQLEEDFRYKAHDLGLGAEYWLHAFFSGVNLELSHNDNIDTLSTSFALVVSMNSDHTEVELSENVYHHCI